MATTFEDRCEEMVELLFHTQCETNDVAERTNQTVAQVNLVISKMETLVDKCQTPIKTTAVKELTAHLKHQDGPEARIRVIINKLEHAVDRLVALREGWKAEQEEYAGGDKAESSNHRIAKKWEGTLRV